MSHQNNSDVYTDIAQPFSFKNLQELKEILIKRNNEASLSIASDGTVTIYTIPVTLRKRVPKGQVWWNKPAVSGTPITFWEGDAVLTRDGRWGTVLGYHWIKSLVIYDELNQPRSGYFILNVEIDGKIESHIRNNLSGERIKQLE